MVGVRERSIGRLHALARVGAQHPGAAGSLREGLAETVTVALLGIRGSLKRTLASTNPCESMIECVRRTSRNVKRLQSGEMALRWTAAGTSRPSGSFAGSSVTATSPGSPWRSNETSLTRVASPADEAGAAQRRAPVVPFAPVEAV
jgi:hypothetical protein